MSTVIEPTHWRLEDNEVVRIDDESGQLVCTKHADHICHHVNQVLELSFDADSVWSTSPVQIPLFGGETGDIWVQVAIEEINGNETFKRASLWDGKQYTYIGLVTHGEGRKAIRDLCAVFINNMYLNESKELNLSCMSSAHSFTRQTKLMNIMSTGPGNEANKQMFWANYWCLRMEQVCVECLDPDFDADIPDDPGTNRYPRARR